MAVKTKHSRSSSAPFSIVLTALLSGMVWYRIGQFVGSSSQHYRRLQDDGPMFGAAPPAAVEYSYSSSNQKRKRQPNRSSRNNNDQQTSTSSIHSTSAGNNVGNNKRAQQQQEQFPYKCGVVFFYHIPSTGGASINTWLRKYANPKKGYNYTYFQSWESDFKGKRSKDIASVVDRSERKFINGMNDHIQNLREDEWRIAHCHINSLHMNETEEMLYRWRETIHQQGCQLVNTIMLRDPLSHALSLHKVIPRKNSTDEEWTHFLKEPTGRGLWATNLDFVLYNKGRRNPHGVPKEGKVKRALELLRRHFEVVTLGNHKLFMDMVLERTGWEYIPMPYTNSFKGELIFEKKRVEL